MSCDTWHTHPRESQPIAWEAGRPRLSRALVNGMDGLPFCRTSSTVSLAAVENFSIEITRFFASPLPGCRAICSLFPLLARLAGRASCATARPLRHDPRLEGAPLLPPVVISRFSSQGTAQPRHRGPPGLDGTICVVAWQGGAG